MTTLAVSDERATVSLTESSRPLAGALAGVSVSLFPTELGVMLHSPALASSVEVGSLWHQVRPAPAVRVRLTSHDAQMRTLRLSVRGDSPAWDARWSRFSFAVRAVPELLGGDAVAAQDVLAPDGTLTLLLLPGETREVSLEFHAALDGCARPGDFLFDVLATDARENTTQIATGLLRLRYAPTQLMELLPAIYREAPNDEILQEPPFFERFLGGFEATLDPIRATLSDLHRVFGPDSSPPEFLPWLATWVALALDENWPELKRRHLIAEAVELYRWRGTKRGLRRYLEIYAGAAPHIEDQPLQGMRLGAEALLGRSTMLGNVPPHTFVVTLAVPEGARLNEEIVRDIIESQKPAHTAYALHLVHRAAQEDGI